MVGTTLGELDGLGDALGVSVGSKEGNVLSVGCFEGVGDGSILSVGFVLGFPEGPSLGTDVGSMDGDSLGDWENPSATTFANSTKSNRSWDIFSSRGVPAPSAGI